MDDCPSKLKSMLEASVRTLGPSLTGLRPEPGRLVQATGCARHGHAGLEPRSENRSAPSGVESTTYSITGCFTEHENPDPRADEHGLTGWPPGPVMSRTGGGASVVVRARESRVHGKGRQSTHAAPKAPRKAMYVAPTPKPGVASERPTNAARAKSEGAEHCGRADMLGWVRGRGFARKVDGEPGA